MQTNRPNQLQLPKTKDVFTQGSRPLIPWCRQKRLGCSHWILETGLCTQMLSSLCQTRFGGVNVPEICGYKSSRLSMVTSTLESTRKCTQGNCAYFGARLKGLELVLGHRCRARIPTWIPRTRSVLALVHIKNY